MVVPPRLRRALVGLPLSLAAGVVLLELALRAALFTPLLGAAAEPLRRAELFADPKTDDDYWKLKYLLAKPDGVRPNPAPDPLLGWRREVFGPAPDYVHDDEARLGRRRPLLFYGDSFAQCLTAPRDCWQGLLERSPWAPALGVLNYGVSGYGLDQVYLLLRETLPRWLDRQPVVVIGVYVGDDLNRTALRLRTWPKPFFELDGPQLVLGAPVGSSPADHLAEHPLAAGSYLWRWLVHGSGLLSWQTVGALSGRSERVEGARERSFRLVRAMHRLLEGHGVPGVFFLMPGEYELSRPEPWGWQERALIAELGRLGARWESARSALLEDAAATGRPLRAYFAAGHYNPTGNEVAFRALDRGLRALARETRAAD